MDSMKTTQFSKTLIAAAVTAVLVGGQLINMPVAIAKSQPAEIMSLQHERSSFSTLIKQVKPAVVSITTTGNGRNMAGLQQDQFSLPDLPESSPFKEFFENMPQLRFT